MSKSRRWSNVSAHSPPIRLEWTPSRQAAAALALLAVLAPFSLVASDLPGAIAWPLAVTVLLAGARAVRRYARLPKVAFVVPLRGPVTRDDRSLAEFEVRWRGPMAFLRWREPGAGTRCLVFFPDTLEATARRELKLAMLQRQAAGKVPAIVPTMAA